MLFRISIFVFAVFIWEAHLQPCGGIYSGLPIPAGPPCPIEAPLPIPSDLECLPSPRPFPSLIPSANTIGLNPALSLELASSQTRVIEPSILGPRIVPRLETASRILPFADSISSVNKIPIGSPSIRPLGRPTLLPTVTESCSLPTSSIYARPCVDANPSISTFVVDSPVASSLADSLQLLILNDLIESTNDYAPVVSETVASAESISQSGVSIATATASSLSEPSIIGSPVNADRFRQPFVNLYRGLSSQANLATPRIPEVFTPMNIETCREPLSNVFRGPNNLITPVLPEVSPVNIEPLRVPYPNVYGGLSNLVNPSLTITEVPRFCGLPNMRPLSIAEVTQPSFPVVALSGEPFINPISASLYEITSIINTLGPILEIADSLSSLASIYGVPVTPALSSSIAIAEAVSSSPLDIVDTSSSAVAIAESITPSAVSVSEAASVVSSDAVIAEPVSSLGEIEASISESVTASSVVTDSSIATATSTAITIEAAPVEVAVKSSNAAATTNYGPTPFNFGGMTPITLEIEFPSLLSPSSFGYATGSAGITPLIYELEIPTIIPTQLTCNVGYVPSTTPVLTMNVSPVSFDCSC